MPKVENMTKAELLELLAKTQDEKEVLEKEKEEQKTAIEVDMSFSETPEERDTRDEAQRKKDFIKKMTHGRWTNEEKYDEFIKLNRRGQKIAK